MCNHREAFGGVAVNATAQLRNSEASSETRPHPGTLATPRDAEIRPRPGTLATPRDAGHAQGRWPRPGTLGVSGPERRVSVGEYQGDELPTLPVASRVWLLKRACGQKG